MRNFFRRLAEGHENGALSYVLNPFLAAAGTVYAGGVRAARALYEKRVFPRKKLPFPVVSVGNLTWGGTGKTPLVEYLARKVSEKHRTALILTRGYGRDEVEQLKHNLPRSVIGVGKDRAQVAENLRKQHRIDLAILDDGLQHWPVARDLEIVTVNALNPFGNRKILPRGILREPLPVLRKASFIVITHSNLAQPEEMRKLKEEIRGLAPQSVLVESYLEPLFFYRARNRSRLSPARLQNQRVTTFSAVGTPRSFQLVLARLGIKPVRNFEFSDHHRFTAAELEEIKKVSLSASVDEIVTTEKDFYRAPEEIGKALDPLVLAARLRISAGEELLTERLFRLLGVAAG